MLGAPHEVSVVELRGIMALASERLATVAGPVVAKRTLLKLIDDLPPSPRITVDDIARRFCAENGIRLQDLRGPERARRFSRPRQHFMWLCVTVHGKTVTEVGRYLNRDHTSVVFGVRAHKERAGL